MSRYAEVVVTLPVPGRYHYRVPEALAGGLAVGHRVLVPFGKRRVTAFVLALSDSIDPEIEKKAKAIESRLDLEPLLPADVLELARFAADYYLASPGEVLKIALPPGLTGASKRKITLTAKGRAALENEAALEPAIAALLRAAERATGVPASKNKQKDVASLLADGLLELENELFAAESESEEEVIERALPAKEAWLLLGRSRARQGLYARLEAGPVPLETLRQELGSGLRASLKHMLDSGVLAKRKATKTPLPAEDPARFPPLSLTEDQTRVFEPIKSAIDRRDGSAFLLQGVTGSGKTEVYMAAIRHALGSGRGAIVLVPEIALTPQLEQRFRARFGEEVIVLHSAVPDGERRRRWQKLRSGHAHIALGARSALWAPVQNLGVVVVDEEHDASFKQGSDVRYQGRDLALVRARQTSSVAILGSATPSLESMLLVKTGRLFELRLPKRVGDRPMPTIEIVDLTAERRAMRGEVRLLSRPLADRLREVVAKKQQAILFLNRRGFNTIVYCQGCGDARKCRHCDVSLTHHRQLNELHCHYCGHTESMNTACNVCGERSVQPFGAGTERVVEAVKEEVPEARVLRLDRDATSKVGALDATLSAFRRGDADVLVGTQMVAKGHDFPRVTLVGIVLADASLAFPDFRAAERTFQLLTQVAGRAGRADDPGHVIIQTFQPGHYALKAAVAHDPDAFYAIEAPSRAEAGYPPHTRLGLVRIESKDQARTRRVAAEVARIARETGSQGYRIVGPAPAPIEKLRDRYRHQLLVFGPTPARLQSVLARLKAATADQPSNVDLIFDVDAIDLL